MQATATTSAPAPSEKPILTVDGQVAGYGKIKNNNPFATRALLFGVLSLLINLLLVPSILAIVFGALGIGKANEWERLGHGPIQRGSAIAGLILGIVGVVVSFVLGARYLEQAGY